jgi:hypothetical protein
MLPGEPEFLPSGATGASLSYILWDALQLCPVRKCFVPLAKALDSDVLPRLPNHAFRTMTT